MCLVEPFSPRCCGRTYVRISKVPSCPDAWPKAKCPAELCIQVGTKEAMPSPRVTCWRCQAVADDKQGWEYEAMRPGIDRAHIVMGLEEIGVAGRRQRIEEGGHCFYCNARGGCQTCGADEIIPGEHLERQSKFEPSNTVLRTKGKGKLDSGRRSKKVKSEQQTYTPSPLSSGFTAEQYPNTLAASISNWQQPYESSNTYAPETYETQNDGLPRYGELDGNVYSASVHGTGAAELGSYGPACASNEYNGTFINGRWVENTNGISQIQATGHDELSAGELYHDLQQCHTEESNQNPHGQQEQAQEPSTLQFSNGPIDPTLFDYDLKPQENSKVASGQDTQPYKNFSTQANTDQYLSQDFKPQAETNNEAEPGQDKSEFKIYQDEASIPYNSSIFTPRKGAANPQMMFNEDWCNQFGQQDIDIGSQVRIPCPLLLTDKVMENSPTSTSTTTLSMIRRIKTNSPGLRILIAG